MQLLRRLYITLLHNLRQQYLEDLLEMQAISTLLCGLHSPAQKQVWGPPLLRDILLGCLAQP
jgi:hypothetical protein